MEPRILVALNVDYRQMGVAGTNSWGAHVLPQYSLPHGEYRVQARRGPSALGTEHPGSWPAGRFGKPEGPRPQPPRRVTAARASSTGGSPGSAPAVLERKVR